MSFNIEYSCHTISNIKHGRRLSLQLMTNCVAFLQKGPHVAKIKN